MRGSLESGGSCPSQIHLPPNSPMEDVIAPKLLRYPRMGLFGGSGLRKLAKEATTFRKAVEGVVSAGSAEPTGPISPEDIARTTAGMVRDRLARLSDKGEDSDALACMQDAFAGAGPEVRAKADELLGVSPGLLAVDPDNA